MGMFVSNANKNVSDEQIMRHISLKLSEDFFIFRFYLSKNLSRCDTSLICTLEFMDHINYCKVVL